MERSPMPRNTGASVVLWQARPLPALDERRCTGCGWCVAACPTECLAMAGPAPWLPRPDACVSCAVCADVCPSDAIGLDRR